MKKKKKIGKLVSPRMADLINKIENQISGFKNEDEVILI